MKRIMIDPSKCDGCKSCMLACMDSHRTDGKTGVETLDFKDPANESRNEIVNDGKGGYLPMFCRHCSSPKCMEAPFTGIGRAAMWAMMRSAAAPALCAS